MPTDLSELWQISILTDKQKTILLTINKHETVAALLIKKFRWPHSAYTSEKRLSLLTSEGWELQENNQTLLVDCLRDKCNLRLIVYVDGGVWPTEEEVRLQIRNPHSVPSLTGRITNDLPDMMGLDDETPRVKMSCGHAIAPVSLALHCYHKLKDGEHSIQCPDLECKAVWSFASITDAACLSSNETNEFQLKMISNRLNNELTNVKQCHGCEQLCRRLNENVKRIHCNKCTSDKGRNFDFCWLCLKEWRNSASSNMCGNLECGDYEALFQSLSTCETKTLNGVDSPSIRACPKCMALIHHDNKCKHIKCPTKSCKYDFCFICLQHYPCKTGPFEACEVAPRQQPTFLAPPESMNASLAPPSPQASRNSSCTIC